MSYRANGGICLACQARGTGCRCTQTESESGDYANIRNACSGSAYRDKTCSTSGIGGVVATRIDIPFSPSFDTPVESRQAESIERSQAVYNPPLLEIPIDPSAPMSGNFRVFQDDGAYYPPPQHKGVQQLPTPPYTRYGQLGSGDYRAGPFMSRGRADCLESLFSLARPGDQLNRISEVSWSPGLSESPFVVQSGSEATVNDPEDPENIHGAMIGSLSLDRNVESNSLPFLLYAYATGLTYFLFEPQRIVHLTRYHVFRAYMMGNESRRTLNLLANHMHGMIQSANYEPYNSTPLCKTEAIIRWRLTEASTHVQASREVDMQCALRAMAFTHMFISSLCVVEPLPSVLSIMRLAAPVFRRACPDPLETFINLPALLTTMIVPLQYYSSLDVLLGVLTSRPMLFRYDVKFTPEVPESLFYLEDGPGIRWSYGVPDRLTLTFAKMNALFEDFGPQVRKEVIDGLEEEIKRMKPIVGASTEPLLSVARMVVQECWFLAALIYLYMGLCGASSTDMRVTEARVRFMRILASIEPKRNPDSFLVFPMVILGVATGDTNERNTMRRRMLGVSECSHRGTIGNDFVRILDHIWAIHRPVVWNDLRQACWEVAGV